MQTRFRSAIAIGAYRVRIGAVSCGGGAVPAARYASRAMSKTWHVAQYNIAWMKTSLDDPSMAEFHANLDPINELGDRSKGFVWRHKGDEGNSTSTRIRDDDRILINFTVWESVEDLFEYAFHSDHVKVYRMRKDWFEHLEEPFAVLWWVPAGHLPTVEEGEDRLMHLTKHGPTPHAFTFKQRFPPPDEAAGVTDVS
jgi:hypothetical protein